MPGLNRRGPENEGPMTGRAKGTCNPRSQDEYATHSFGQGQGMRRGRGRGLCHRNGRTAATGNNFSCGQASLQKRVEILVAELANTRTQLKNQL